jgi:hypothetical protein
MSKASKAVQQYMLLTTITAWYGIDFETLLGHHALITLA